MSQRRKVAQVRQAVGVVAADRFFEPAHAEVVEFGADAAGLADGVAAVGVDHQLDCVAGQFAQPPDPLEVPVDRWCPTIRRS